VLFDYLDQHFNQNTLKACQLISTCAGRQGMIIGQIADMNLSDVEMTIDNLAFINQNKTGKLLEASIVSPGLLLGLSDKTIEKLTQLSMIVGLAFQLKDDLLEVEGDEQTLGKPINSDIKNKKMTYINSIGLKATKDKLNQLQHEAKNILKQLSIDDEFINALIDYIFIRTS
jgi:geranylgeranyl diphosphate synthase type II